ncbi:MAG: hypothetical protein PHX51_00750 [Clostridia bacterium]|nr:hypothetical protein [Clostridia bacterium]
MKGGFFAGLTLGAIAGAVMLEASPEIKQLIRQGKQMVTDKMQQGKKKKNG